MLLSLAVVLCLVGTTVAASVATAWGVIVCASINAANDSELRAVTAAVTERAFLSIVHSLCDLLFKSQYAGRKKPEKRRWLSHLRFAALNATPVFDFQVPVAQRN